MFRKKIQFFVVSGDQYYALFYMCSWRNWLYDSNTEKIPILEIHLEASLKLIWLKFYVNPVKFSNKYL